MRTPGNGRENNMQCFLKVHCLKDNDDDWLLGRFGWHTVERRATAQCSSLRAYGTAPHECTRPILRGVTYPKSLGSRCTPWFGRRALSRRRTGRKGYRRYRGSADHIFAIARFPRLRLHAHTRTTCRRRRRRVSGGPWEPLSYTRSRNAARRKLVRDRDDGVAHDRRMAAI